MTRPLRVAAATALLAATLLAAGGCFRQARASADVPPPQAADPPKAPPASRHPARSPAPSEPPADPENPRLLEGAETPDPRVVGERIARGEKLAAELEARDLEPAEREQTAAAKAFLGQARAALAEGQVQRAAILADKATILLETTEQASRPAVPTPGT